MTIKTAACAIIDDLVDSGSFLRTQVSACDFGLLDAGPTCVVILRPGLSTFESVAYGGVLENTWGLIAQGWIKDTGSVTEDLGRVWDMHDALLGAISGGSNANGPTLLTRVVSMSHDPNSLFVFGGNGYFLVNATITSREDP